MVIQGKYAGKRPRTKLFRAGTALLVAFVFLSVSAPIAKSQTRALRPNILLILADDVGFSDLGCYGSEIATPNLDRLASEGLRFRQFYNAARCCPSRASLLTGLYPQEAGMGDMAGQKMGPLGYEGRLMNRCVTIPEVLKPAGYLCYMVGKWHVGAKPNPIDRGFDEFYGMIGGFNSCWVEHPYYTRLPSDHPRRQYPPGKFYSTDVFGDYALDFMADARREGKPWFLYLAFNAAHFPLHAPEAEIDKYENVYQQGWDKIREERYKRMNELGVLPGNTLLTPRGFIPANWANKQTGWADKYNPPWDSLPADRRADLARRMAVYAGMVDRMDQNIGRVIADLRRHGELDNTLVIFLSDNGACAEWDPYGFDGATGPHNVLHTGDDLKNVGGPGSYISYGSAWANACNTPWRLYKHYDHEGGISTPCIVRWPAVVKQQGKMNDTPCDIFDLLPTLIEVAGANYPKTFNGHAILPLEGLSLMPVFKDGTLPPRTLFFEHEGNRAVRENRWKLVSLKGQPWELYDFDDDRSELNNLTAQHPDIAARLAKEWDGWAERCHVRQPKPVAAGQGSSAPSEVAPKERED